MDVHKSELQQELDRLSLPGEGRDALSFCEPSVESLNSYLENLPQASPAELCNRLYRILPEISSLKAHPGKKLALLERIRPDAFDCVERLTRNLAVTSATTKVVSLSIAMLRYLAQGYKSVLTAALEHPAPPVNIVLQALYAAISVHGQMLMICWACYLTPPSRLWLELHALYNIARLRNLETVSIGSLQASNLAETTPKAAYVKPLLFACADPARYTPPDLRTIAGFLTNAGNLVEFASGLQEGIFVVDCHSDQGPLYSFKVTGTTRHHFRLRPHRLVSHIEDQLRDRALTGLSERLARDLCHYWSQEIQRLDSPGNDDTSVEIIFGLTHIHRQMTGTDSIEEYLRSLGPGNPANWLQPEVEDAERTHRDMFLQRTSQQMIHAKKATPIDYTPETASQTPSRHYRGRRLNRSENGAGIEFSAPAENLTAGELIAIRPEGEENWQFGLVRWTRVTPGLMRQIGVKLFHAGMEPCAASMNRAATGMDETWSGASHTLSPEGDKHGSSASRFFSALWLRGQQRILLPSLPFRPYMEIALYTGRDIETYRLLDTEEATYHINFFKLQPLPHSGLSAGPVL